MRLKIQQKITDLTAEVENLVHVRDGLSQQLSEINTRVTQIIGAIKELNEILQSEEQDEETTNVDDGGADSQTR